MGDARTMTIAIINKKRLLSIKESSRFYRLCVDVIQLSLSGIPAQLFLHFLKCFNTCFQPVRILLDVGRVSHGQREQLLFRTDEHIQGL